MYFRVVDVRKGGTGSGNWIYALDFGPERVQGAPHVWIPPLA